MHGLVGLFVSQYYMGVFFHDCLNHAVLTEVAYNIHRIKSQTKQVQTIHNINREIVG